MKLKELKITESDRQSIKNLCICDDDTNIKSVILRLKNIVHKNDYDFFKKKVKRLLSLINKNIIENNNTYINNNKQKYLAGGGDD